ETALDSWDTRIPTGKFNALLAELTAEHPHPVRGGKQPRILFGTQASTRPPTFVLFTTGFLDPQYRRFIQRRLREVYGFEGTPIVVNMRVREKRRRYGVASVEAISGLRAVRAAAQAPGFRDAACGGSSTTLTVSWLRSARRSRTRLETGAPYTAASATSASSTVGSSGARPGRSRLASSASTATPVATQKVTWKAFTASAGLAAPVMSSVSTTASTAVPNAPPICWEMREIIVACGISSWLRPVIDTVMSGMSTVPSPRPRTTSTADSHTFEVSASARAKGTVPIAMSAKPITVSAR